jgi:hypothetical protein
VDDIAVGALVLVRDRESGTSLGGLLDRQGLEKRARESRLARAELSLEKNAVSRLELYG